MLRELYRRRRKRRDELSYWRGRKSAEGELHDDHYAGLFTGLVGLEPDFYAGKDVLDIGCGPRGSLNWADMAQRRVGLDPLAADYRELGIESHPMEYVAAGAEAMPFADASFDVVTSLNSLDHVDDLDRVIAEVKRVLRPGGHLVLVVEVGHERTWTEPQVISWDVCELFKPELEVLRSHEYDRPAESMYAGAWAGRAYDHGDPTPRPGLLVALLRATSVSRVRSG